MVLMLRRFHPGRTRIMPSFTGCGGSCHGAITSLGALQGFTFIALGFLGLGRLFIFGVDGVVP